VAKILIVEDDGAAAKQMASQLNAAGHACAVRHEGNRILEVLRRGEPDLLVLDVMLPDSSGFEICRSIRRDGELFNLPILIVSAMTDGEEIQHGLAQGADMYLTKPYNAGQLVERVDTLLRDHGRGENTDALTQLPNHDGVRRELQKRIGRDDTFGLVYVEMTNLRTFAKLAKAEGREKAIRHLGRALRICGRELCEDSMFFVGHMGSGHYMCILPVDAAEPLSKRVREIWIGHVEDLYEQLGQSQRLQDARSGKGEPALDIQCYVTFRRDTDTQSAQELMDIVSRIRSTVGGTETGGIHVDRRA
jgi:DNA-binding response OmpR family regulator